MSLRLAVGVASLALFASAAAGGYYSVVKAAGNMHVVVADELYRSAQPSADQIADYSRRYGIKTIVNLRGGHTGEAWYDSELSEARALGIAHVDFRMAARKDLTEAQAADLVGLLEGVEKPVLIHCDDGAGRTGLAAALYVAAVKKLGENAAEDQLSVRFGNIPLPLTSAFVMDRSFEALEPWLGYSNS
jgi:protein tyrosine/serine phosphatase